MPACTAPPPRTRPDGWGVTAAPDRAAAAAGQACQRFCRQAVERRAGRKKVFGKWEVLPGARMLSQLVAHGVSLAATSNTLPEQLGEGRFAAQDFLREIHTLASIFTVVRIAGPDYRHRDLPPAPEPPSDEQVAADAARVDGATLDDFDALCAHLGTMHPSRYLTACTASTTCGPRRGCWRWAPAERPSHESPNITAGQRVALAG